jgi:2-phosphosulfolactate phosphatase
MFLYVSEAEIIPQQLPGCHFTEKSMIENLDVFSTSGSFSEEDVRNKTVVVIDVLRACSTIQTALENGATGIIPVSESGDVMRYTRYLDSRGILLCGEKDGVKIEGYHLGNSPLEYTGNLVNKKTLVFRTTNGTQAITRSTHGKEVLIGSFLNLSAIVDYLKNNKRSRIAIICSGWKTRLSIEDMLCAGAVTYHLYNKKLPENAMDGAKVAFGLYQKFRKDIRALVASSNHARRLRELGFEKDVEYCCEIDKFASVPVLNDGMIAL